MSTREKMMNQAKLLLMGLGRARKREKDASYGANSNGVEKGMNKIKLD